MTRSCAFCGQALPDDGLWFRRYCGLRCRRNAWSIRQGRGVKFKTAECAICGVTFTGTGGNGLRRYCGERCWKVAKNQRARKPREQLQRLSALRGFTVAERFWSKVDKTGDCWLWTAGCTRAGYGQFHPSPGVKVYAHRWSYEHHRGSIPDGLHVLHSCDNPPCVNPAHLRAGTQADNIRDAIERGRMVRGSR